MDFPAASGVFDDPGLLVGIDPRNYGGETRIRAIGRVGDQVILVCYTMRGEVRRIISARKRNRRERTAYSP
ncbi:MAG: BrnT family toxin [Stellaceae bacterium]